MNLKNYLLLPIFIALLALNGCSGSNDSDKSSASHNSVHSGIKVSDAWVAQKPDMTGVFGVVMNHTDKDITITGGTSEVATKVELHETVAAADGSMKMRPKPGGFTIKANSMHELAPGKDHIMLMGLSRELKPGEQLRITLELSNGYSFEFTAPVKPFTGADQPREVHISDCLPWLAPGRSANLAAEPPGATRHRPDPEVRGRRLGSPDVVVV